jgi:hypothetical protein
MTRPTHQCALDKAGRYTWWSTDITDTFRIRIWLEDEVGAHVDYDNDVNQSLGDSSIFVHTGK